MAMDDASSALIAKLLQEDNDYAMQAMAGFLDSSDEDDDGAYVNRRKRKKKGGRRAGGAGSAKGKRRAVDDDYEEQRGSDGEDDYDEDDEDAYSDGSGGKKRRRRRKSGGSAAKKDGKRAAPRRWSNSEEKKFEEALGLYGRDWKKCAEHLDSGRKPRDVASHAQKYFIKLYKEDKPLPDKVRESGEGYTLSGKPLDPNSAAARAYGVHGSRGQRAYREETAKAKRTKTLDGLGNSDEEQPQDQTQDQPQDKTQDQSQGQEALKESENEAASVDENKDSNGVVKEVTKKALGKKKGGKKQQSKTGAAGEKGEADAADPEKEAVASSQATDEAVSSPTAGSQQTSSGESLAATAENPAAEPALASADELAKDAEKANDTTESMEVDHAQYSAAPDAIEKDKISQEKDEADTHMTRGRSRRRAPVSTTPAKRTRSVRGTAVAKAKAQNEAAGEQEAVENATEPVNTTDESVVVNDALVTSGTTPKVEEKQSENDQHVDAASDKMDTSDQDGVKTENTENPTGDVSAPLSMTEDNAAVEKKEDDEATKIASKIPSSPRPCCPGHGESQTDKTSLDSNISSSNTDSGEATSSSQTQNSQLFQIDGLPEGFDIMDESADLSTLSARQRNDVLLARMKAKGIKLGQKVDKSFNDGDDGEDGGKGTPSSGGRARRGPTGAAEERRRLAAKRKQDAWEKQQAKQQQVYGSDGRTEYSRNRSRRRTATRFIQAPSEALEFVPVSQYQGPPASGPRAQPFHVKVHSSVYATVDLHAHLSTSEVMGFLAGTFDAEKLSIEIKGAYPGRSMIDGATECEMDPMTEVNLREAIQKDGLTVVGWYHSHPTFEPVPSQCDVANQANYQALFRDGPSNLEPFLGLIFSPYDLRLPQSNRSQFSWFYVESPTLTKTAKRIEADLVCDSILPSEARQRMQTLVEEKDQSSCAAVDFSQVWRSLPGQEPCTYAEKVRRSLAFWLPPLVHNLVSEDQRRAALAASAADAAGEANNNSKDGSENADDTEKSDEVKTAGGTDESGSAEAASIAVTTDENHGQGKQGEATKEEIEEAEAEASSSGATAVAPATLESADEILDELLEGLMHPKGDEEDQDEEVADEDQE
mmetsp:Transcript_6951/g.12315  ORF Transcript_6951/g.12315 Transcript_6951/m.12315 type:complete len:1105 (+) Transcript_6951:345-3659(+)|eukprot:CAMPEP_0171491784 /NCGR_PEP_ID=MMETSP0958-20121227/4046_1 /TAXON_ID=87120 /ORGANISM="Aurantiochytrium limacinum, Strain ATCCMYA-1381" /LENGTH=1104 /DNA_ID=CAMNT_0012025229 /DNA_START=262 /DNA_END=3576 /DNA_ORIENTATION=-